MPRNSSSNLAAGRTVSHVHTWALTILLLKTTGARADSSREGQLDLEAPREYPFDCELCVCSDSHPKLPCPWSLPVQMPVPVPMDLADPDHDLTH